jgi:AcrR family transcriptional regulator
VAERRPYSSKRRAAQAAQTRQDVVDAAVELFATAGWTGTTLTALAARAGVAVETVYAGFDSKKGVLRAVLDQVLGDELPAVSGRKRDERVAALVEAVADGHERSAGVWRALPQAASGDGEVEGWRAEVERRRRAALGSALQAALDKDLDPLLLDLVWALLGPDVRLHLVEDAGWSRDEYTSAMTDAVLRLIGPVRKRRS